MMLMWKENYIFEKYIISRSTRLTRDSFRLDYISLPIVRLNPITKLFLARAMQALSDPYYSTCLWLVCLSVCVSASLTQTEN